MDNIDRRSGLSLAEFRAQYELPNRPVVLTDVVGGWWGWGVGGRAGGRVSGWLVGWLGPASLGALLAGMACCVLRVWHGGPHLTPLLTP